MASFLKSYWLLLKYKVVVRPQIMTLACSFIKDTLLNGNSITIVEEAAALECAFWSPGYSAMLGAMRNRAD